MVADLQRGDRYREIAKEIRAVAKTLTFDEAQASLLVLADTYERMAERLDREERKVVRGRRRS